MSQGLVGALKGVANLPKLNPLAWIIRFVAVAGIILIAKKAGFDFNWTNSAVILTLGLAALCGEFYFSGEVVRSWHDRSIAGVLAFALLWGCAFAYSVNQWLGAASDGQFEKAGFQQAAFIRTQDAAATEAELQADVKRIQDKLKIAPTRTPEAARADQDNAKAHRFWKLTDGCKSTRGPQTREFCSAYASAVSAESLATEAITLREELKVKQADLKKVREDRKDAPVAVSSARTDLRMYTQYIGMSEEQAMDLQAAGTIIFISFVMSGLGMLTESQRHRGQPTKPWNLFGWLGRLIWGRREEDTPAASASHEPGPTPIVPRVAQKTKSWFEDCYKPQCLTVGIAPVAT
jgi:hypothetical protein